MTIDTDRIRAEIERDNTEAALGDHRSWAPELLEAIEQLDELKADLGEALDGWDVIAGPTAHGRIAELRKRAQR